MNDQAARPRGDVTGRKLLVMVGVLAGATAVVGLACSLVGQYELNWGTWQLRAARLLAATGVGAALAVGGVALQAMLRNPLAEPYILGISSGAGVGVLAGTALLSLSGLTTPVLALLGSLTTCTLVYLIAQRRGRLDPYVLLLSGVIVGVLNGAIMFTMLIFAEPNKLLDFIRWGIGDVPQSIWARPALLGVCGGGIAVGWVVLVVRGAAFDTLALGDEVASSAGVGTHWLRIETFFVVSLMTAAAVCLAGPIGFVGLIVPHICRLIVGPGHAKLAVISGFAGAIFLMLADTLCRTAGPSLAGQTVPVGVVTALVGGPLFIFLLRRKSSAGP